MQQKKRFYFKLKEFLIISFCLSQGYGSYFLQITILS